MLRLVNTGVFGDLSNEPTRHFKRSECGIEADHRYTSDGDGGRRAGYERNDALVRIPARR